MSLTMRRLLFTATAVLGFHPSPASAEPAAPPAGAPLVTPAPQPSATEAPAKKAASTLQLSLGPTTLTPVAELRGRFEYRARFGFDAEASGQRSFDLLRTRAGLRLDWAALTLYADAMDAQEFVTDPARRSGFQPFDLHQAFVEVKHPLELPVGFKLGRQEMNLGSRLLVSSATWSNLVRAWDLARLSADGDGWLLEGFFGRVVQAAPDELDTWKTGENFWGFYGTYKPADWIAVDAYLLGVHDQPMADPKRPVKGEDGQIGSATRYTPGVRLAGAALEKALEYEAELALQFGHRAEDSIRAGAGRATVGYRFDAPWTPRVRGEFTFASGDHDAKDGVAGAFSPLFGTTHEPFGAIDFFRWQNMEEVGLVASARPHKTVEVVTEYHAFWLADAHDNWVNSSGAVLRKGLAEGGPSFVGHEVDARVIYQPLRQLRIEPGCAVFVPQDFVEATGTSDPATWFYLQMVASL